MAKEITLKIYTKMVDFNGKKFASYSTRMNLPYTDKDGVEHGVQNRSVELKFTSDFAPKNNAKMFGLIKVASNKIDFPTKWVVKKDDDGKSLFPTAWIKGEWKYIEVEREATQDMFVLDSVKSETSEEPIEIEE